MVKILCLEDDRFLQRLYQRSLNGVGEIVIAGNGREGLEYFQKSPQDYQLIITDNNMPSMSGLEFLAIIKEYKQPLRLMVSTPVNEEPQELHQQVRELGGLGLYEKPVDVMKLKVIVAELIKDGKSKTLENYFRKKGFRV